MRAVTVIGCLALAGCGESIPDGPIPGVSKSDNYATSYGPKFEAAARELLRKGRCKVADFVEMGGFTRSTNAETQGQYFIYCGVAMADRIYIKVSGPTFEVVN